MAVTKVTAAGKRFQKDTITFTADGSQVLTYPRMPVGLAFTSDGVDGGGTLTWFASNDGTTFSALGVNTAADPKNTTSVTSATASGNWTTHAQDCAFEQFKFTLASSTNPTLVLTVFARF